MDALRCGAVGLVVVLVVQRLLARRSRRVWLVADATGNEALVVDAEVAGRRTLFLIDTAYAGAPVLSTTFLCVEHKCAWGDVASRYRRALALLPTVSDDARATSVRRLLAAGRCRGFTSGCTMRLMGIGETTETQSDMLLCPAIGLNGRMGAQGSSPDADVLVSNPLKGSPHILTTDYLLHRAPVLLCPRAGVLRLRAPPTDALGFEFFAARSVGGAFAVPMTVGGRQLEIVVDTGAAAPLSLAASAAATLETCESSATQVTQVGVNGERICSDVLTAPVRLGRIDLGVVPVFANDHEVQGADGYAGMGLLRCLDLWLEPARIGFRRSGLPAKAPATTTGSCGKRLPQCSAKA